MSAKNNRKIITYLKRNKQYVSLYGKFTSKFDIDRKPIDPMDELKMSAVTQVGQLTQRI